MTDQLVTVELARAPADAGSRRGGTRAAGVARDGAQVAIAASILFAVWELRAQFVGTPHVLKLATQTADGGAVGVGLATAIWGSLAVSLVAGILSRRSRQSQTPSGLPARPPDTVAARESWRAWWPAAVGLAFVVGVYHRLLLPGAITWGDWGYFLNPSAVRSFFPVPSLWSFSNLGSSNILGASVAPIDAAMGGLAGLGIPYVALERVFFYYPAILLADVGPLLLARRLGAKWTWAAAAGVLFAVNPYALVLFSGGQLTVGMGYALLPFAALAALRLWSRRTVAAGLLLGLVVGIEGWYDPRTAGLAIASMLVAGGAALVGSRGVNWRRMPWLGGASGVLLFSALQGPWLLPALFAVRAQLPAAYTTTAALRTFSLMSLADGLTLFHPFWPTMHFIALHSVPALWLIVPIGAALALLRCPGDPLVQAGVALFLVFAALVSGANAPFGAINSWLFLHVPGMDLFRDPSPYFGPIALGLLLVGASLGRRDGDLEGLEPDLVAPANGSGNLQVRAPDASKDTRGHSPKGGSGTGGSAFLAIVAFGAACMLMLSGWPALSGTLRHALQPRTIPHRYRLLEHAVLANPPGAVLWIPSPSRFAPVSPAHPSISAIDLGQDAAAGFPAASTPLAWLAVPHLVGDVLAQYHVTTVVVRENASSYRTNSLPFPATPTVALRSLDATRPAAATNLGGLVVLSETLGSVYPGTVFQTRVQDRSEATLTGERGRLTPRREVLAARFTLPSLAGWGPVGNGNNYLHQSLDAAGISASVARHGSLSWLHLAVRYGSAAIGHQLASCPRPGLVTIAFRYRTSAGGVVTASIFSAAQGPPIATVTLPPTGGAWAVASPSAVLAEGLGAAAAGVPVSGCVFELSAAPGTAGVPSGADIASATLTETSPSENWRVAALTGGGQTWSDPASPTDFALSETGATMQWILPPAYHPRLAVFWQRFDPGWRASIVGSSMPLRHVEADSWANGFVVPPSSAAVTLRIIYTPEHFERDGFVLLLAGLLLAILSGGGTSLWRARTRHRSSQ